MEGRCLDRSAGVELDYVSTGCSLSPHSCAWSQQGLVAFGSNRSVSLYSADYHSQRTGRVLGTLNGHTARVNCVAWIPSLQRSQQRDGNSRLLELVSGSVDKQLIFWQVRRDFTSDGQQQSIALVSQQMLTMHTDVVVSVHACRHENATLLASSSADCSVRVWRRPHDDAPFECMQKLACGRRGYVLDVSFGILPAGGLPILACACDDFHIHLWACGKGEDGTTDTWRCVQQLVGHEDWVRTVHFAQCPTASDTHKGAGDLLLASGAQDSYVRIWRVSANSKPADLPAGQLAEIRLRENTFTVGESQFSATLDAVLSGHEHWVYGVHWQPAIEEMDGTHHQPLCLVSSSMDKTVIVWRYNAEASVWLDESRMGDIGGNTLGFYGAIFSPCGEQILGHGYQGAFHLWRHDVGARSWWPQVTVSGHFGPVFDITWSQNGCLLSVSKDQTCRLHGEWCRSIDDRSIVTWHELARPQIHGYDLQCIAMTSPFRYACGADEKVVRVFDASTLFLANLSRISGREMHSEVALPLGATVPALGLSNKAVYDGDEATKPKQEDDEEQFGAADVNRLPSFSAREMTSPPVEEDLLQNTLWPETQKLYGHSYELYSLASDGKHWLASACKASKAEFSSILLWNTATWSLAATLRYHNLTVTQLSFSHSGEFLLAVSRDRMWSLWQHDESKSEGKAVICSYCAGWLAGCWSFVGLLSVSVSPCRSVCFAAKIYFM